MPGYDHREEDTSRSIFRQLAQGDRLAAKEQFSDGVGYGWIDTLKKITSESVTDEEMANAAKRFPINPPQNKEEYYYRSIFEEHFPSESAARSVPSIPSVAVFYRRGFSLGLGFQKHERAKRQGHKRRT